MTWEPISREELQRLLDAETAMLDADGRATLSRYGIEPRHVYRIFPYGSAEADPVYVIARDGPRVVFYDDTEEEFGTATLDEDGVMRDWGTWGERLSWALRQFPEPAVLRSRPPT